MGYFLSLAKFSKSNRIGYILLAIFVPALVHGLFDWLLMVTDGMSIAGQIVMLVLFVILDVIMWIVGVRSIRAHRERSPFKKA